MIARLDSGHSRLLMLLAALMALALALHLWQASARRAGGTAGFESALCSIARPLQSALMHSVRFAEREWAIVIRARKLSDENARLRARVEELEQSLSAVAEQGAAAARTSRLLTALPPAGPKCVARVIGIGEGGWSDLLTLDAGSSRGVQPRDVALSAAGLVGQVVAVTADTARVLPISEPASSVAVRIQRSRECGILKGSGGAAAKLPQQDPGAPSGRESSAFAPRCELRYLDPQADVRPGDAIITSGLGGIFPAGLRVGSVTKVRKDRDAPGNVAEVRPWADIRKTEEVLLISARSAAN